MHVPYKPAYKISPHLLNLISQISELKAYLNQSLVEVSYLPILQREARVRATHSSTAIEGNPLTLAQVEAISQGKEVGAPWQSELEVKNYLKALRWVENHQKGKITEAAILKLHSLVTKGLLEKRKSGKYKDKQNYVVNEKGIKIYTPPPPAETPRLTKQLIKWLNSDEAKNLNSIIVSSIAHHRLVSVHPFSDGNGRLSRLVGTWVLYQRGFDTKHIFYTDEYFETDRKKYYLKIQQARQLDNDLTYWIEYVAEGILETLDKVKKRIESLKISTRTKIHVSPRQEDILRILRDKSSLPSRELQRQLKLTRARINQLIQPLVKEGIVVKEGQTRATFYRLAN